MSRRHNAKDNGTPIHPEHVLLHNGRMSWQESIFQMATQEIEFVFESILDRSSDRQQGLER